MDFIGIKPGRVIHAESADFSFPNQRKSAFSASKNLPLKSTISTLWKGLDGHEIQKIEE
jgi:hypothetical protein